MFTNKELKKIKDGKVNSAPVTRSTSAHSHVSSKSSGTTYSATQPGQNHPKAEPDTPSTKWGTPAFNADREHLVAEPRPFSLEDPPWGKYPDSRDLYTGLPFPMPVGGWAHDERTDYRRSVKGWFPKSQGAEKAAEGKTIEDVVWELWHERSDMKMEHWLENFAPPGTYFQRDQPATSKRNDAVRGKAKTRYASPESRALAEAEVRAGNPDYLDAWDFSVTDEIYQGSSLNLSSLDMIAPRVWGAERLVGIPPHWEPLPSPPPRSLQSLQDEAERGRDIQPRESEPEQKPAASTASAGKKPAVSGGSGGNASHASKKNEEPIASASGVSSGKHGGRATRRK